MANEITVPLLPCHDIDVQLEFYTMLGFEQTYYQRLPNPCIGVKREDLQMQFFGMPDYKPEDSYSTCLVMVDDTSELFEAFAARMKAAYGKILVAGIPRMTRPRKRKNADRHSGFTVIDPGGNWVRIMAKKPSAEEEAPDSKFRNILLNAIVLGDSHGSHARAAQILDDAIARNEATASPAEMVEALAYRAELALRDDDQAAADGAIARARAIPLSDAERERLADALASLDDLRAIVVSPGPT